MTWSDIPRNPTTRALRQFAAAWLVFFLALGTQQYFRRGHHEIGLAAGLIAVVFGVLGLVRPFGVRWLFHTWMVLAFPIGWLVSQAMLLLMFYLLITPVALFFRALGRDPLSRKPAPNRASFWEPKRLPDNVRSYFRQY
jgi:hypothetical protein